MRQLVTGTTEAGFTIQGGPYESLILRRTAKGAGSIVGFASVDVEVASHTADGPWRMGGVNVTELVITGVDEGCTEAAPPAPVEPPKQRRKPGRKKKVPQEALGIAPPTEAPVVDPVAEADRVSALIRQAETQVAAN